MAAHGETHRDLASVSDFSKRQRTCAYAVVNADPDATEVKSSGDDYT